MEIDLDSLDLKEHPASKAWRVIHPECSEPTRIETLKDKEDGRAVFRLEGMDSQGGSVIAKRCWKRTGSIEHILYAQVLPRLPVTVPRFYGFAEEQGEFCWLFLEDVGAERFSMDIDQHRVIAARWLGKMHVAAASLAPVHLLPDRGPGHYLEHLRTGRERILQNLHNPALTSDGVALLEKVISECDILESSWDRILIFCEQIPSTLVHGDFRPKNIRVLRLQNEITIFPLDWETAGWGVPAVDLAPARRLLVHQVDLAIYHNRIRASWPEISFSTLEKLVGVGLIFRRLAAIDWASLSLEYPWPEKAIARMQIYQDELSTTIRARPWTS